LLDSGLETNVAIVHDGSPAQPPAGMCRSRARLVADPIARLLPPDDNSPRRSNA